MLGDTRLSVPLFQHLSNGNVNDFDILDKLHARVRNTLLEYLKASNAPSCVIELHSDLLALTVDMMSRMSAEDVSIFDWDMQMIVPLIVSNDAKVKELLCQGK